MAILINNANEVLTMESDIKLPRRREQMSELGLKKRGKRIN